MSNTDHYTYRITWSVEDQEFVGLCAEFPALSWLDASAAAALEGVITLVSSVVREMLAVGEIPPIPIAEKNFSGKLVLRMPPEQHRRLATLALEEGVSLNRYLCSRLAG
ncbi:type II toxin-antitoxin system HicB family antitoxin [Edaphovirga cremea]|uniref:type II toxin-antitoxin system HicB family antitoxin n=1 Tax=Edaphovirga cremea TaxID=2267246 RepID=UPI00398A22D7